MTAHTPGPWEFTTLPDSGGGVRPVVARGLDIICAVSRRGDAHEESEANARLIAAAPDLLAALRLLCEETATMFGPVAAARSPGLGCARAAVSRVEGREP